MKMKTILIFILLAQITFTSNVERIERYVEESMAQHERMHGPRKLQYFDPNYYAKHHPVVTSTESPKQYVSAAVKTPTVPVVFSDVASTPIVPKVPVFPQVATTPVTPIYPVSPIYPVITPASNTNTILPQDTADTPPPYVAPTTNSVSSGWQPLRIAFFILPDVPYSYQENINDALNVAQAFFASHFLVQRSASPLQFSQTGYAYCFDSLITQQQASATYDADMVFFVTVDTNSQYLASAGPCAYDPTHQRPIFGQISFGLKFALTGSVSDVQFEHSAQTVLHEIIHGLGFIRNMYKWYFNSATNQNHPQTSYISNGVTYLATPRVLAYTQFYFGCASAQGLPMENEGGSGTADSHLERSIFMNEIMTGSDITGDTIFSIFTFKVLEDSGWYRLGNIKPDIMQFGQLKGCNFLNKRCRGGTFPEFCNVGDPPACSFGNTGQGSCLIDNLADKCGVLRIYSDFDCRDQSLRVSAQDWKNSMISSNIMQFQYNSICFTGSFSTDAYNVYPNSCHIRSCSSDNKVMTMNIGGTTYTCTDGLDLTSQTLSGDLYCPPNVQQQCFSFNECPNQCSQKGFCIAQKCICAVGYSGKGCETSCSTYRNNADCVTRCPVGTYNEDSTMQCLGCPYGCAKCSDVGTCVSCKTGFTLSYSFCERDLSVILSTEQILISQRVVNDEELTVVSSGLIMIVYSLIIFICSV